MAQIVRQADRFGQGFIQLQRERHGTCDLSDFDGVGDPRAVKVALVIHEHLGLVDQAPEGVGMDDPIAIPLKFAAEFGFRFGVAAPA